MLSEVKVVRWANEVEGSRTIAIGTHCDEIA
jgi:hypothetical protein